MVHLGYMKLLRYPLIKLLFIISLIFGLVFLFFKTQELKKIEFMNQRQYPVEIYENSKSFSQYFLYAEYELKNERNKRLDKIVKNFNQINNVSDEKNVKRKKMIQSQIGKNNYIRLIKTVKLLTKIKGQKHPIISDVDSWDLYFFEKSSILKYLEDLQAPVLDNDLVRNIKNE